MPMRRSLTVLNSTRDLTMGRGQVIDNAGQRSPCNTPYNADDECLIGGQIIDNFGQRSPHSSPFGNENDCIDRGQVIDNAGQ